MTEYSSDDDDRRTGRSSSDLTPDDFDFDIANYTASASQNAFFSRSDNRFNRKNVRAKKVSEGHVSNILFHIRPPESKKTERQRSKNDSRQGASSKVVFTEIWTALNTMNIGGQGDQDDPRDRGIRRLWPE